MGRIGLGELIIILIVVLLLFGAKRLPEIAVSLRDALREFRKVEKDAEEGAGENSKKDPHDQSK